MKDRKKHGQKRERIKRRNREDDRKIKKERRMKRKSPCSSLFTAAIKLLLIAAAPNLQQPN
jgi:hypothetical protein